MTVRGIDTMTLRMLDSIYPQNLPAGADAYLGYVDGKWATYATLKARFPGAHVLGLAVFASDLAEGYDREPLDVDVTQIAGAVKRSLAAGYCRPVAYASASNMGACWAALAAAGIGRSQVRLLSAHYGTGEHICGPGTCAYPGCPPCDGTQWTDKYPGTGGALIDASILAYDFFGGTMAITQADADLTAETTLKLDGLIASPDPASPNKFWSAAHALADLLVQVRLIKAAIGAEDQTVIAGVLAGLSSADIAAAISELGDSVAADVLSRLKAQFDKP